MSPKAQTAAHEQKVTRAYTLHYPDHAPREGDPHYVDFEHYRRQHVGTARCAMADTASGAECNGGLELHHAHVEYAMQNGIDLAALEAAYPGVSNPDEVGAWVESGANLIFYCLLPSVPIRMGDGSEKPIAQVRVGDAVMTHDGTIQPVLAAFRKPYRGEVIRLGSTLLTPTHRVLTNRGWLTAAEVARHFRVHGPEVVLLRCEEEQVARGVVRSVPIDVMDTFGWKQGSADQPLHNIPMLHNLPGFSVYIREESDIALRGNLSASSVKVLPRRTIQSSEATGVGTVSDLAPNAASVSECFSPATLTNDRSYTIGISNLLAPRSGTLPAAGGVSPRNGFRGEKASATDDALPFRQRGALSYGGWYALREVSSLTYTGYVHDISIAYSHSFVASGLVVHNCAWHHRGHGGVHVAAAADFEAERFVRNLIS